MEEKAMQELTIIKQNGGAYIDSREVAEAIGKRHDHLLRDIKGYCKTIEKVTDPKIGVSSFFVESTYFDSTGRELLCYLISKMGCELVANKLTGEKGVLFSVAYVVKFNEMEAAEREAEIKAHARPRLNEYTKAARTVLNGFSQCCVMPDSVMNFLRGVYEPLGIEIIPHGYDDYELYYTVTEIAQQLGIYSETGRPHGHAVSAIITKLENAEHHAVAIPFGLVGVSMRYDYRMIERVRKWITDNGFPCEVPYDGFAYHLYYDRQLSMFDYGEDVLNLNIEIRIY
jgi:Rha family phage regulatory protein